MNVFSKPIHFADLTEFHNYEHAQLRWHNIASSLNLAGPLLYFSVSLIQSTRSTYPVLVIHVQITGRTQARGPYDLSRVLS